LIKLLKGSDNVKSRIIAFLFSIAQQRTPEQRVHPKVPRLERRSVFLAVSHKSALHLVEEEELDPREGRSVSQGL
jgi:hypothetical protein